MRPFIWMLFFVSGLIVSSLMFYCHRDDLLEMQHTVQAIQQRSVLLGMDGK